MLQAHLICSANLGGEYWLNALGGATLARMGWQKKKVSLMQKFFKLKLTADEASCESRACCSSQIQVVRNNILYWTVLG